jgi:uncharacterized protein (TIGR02145 family)
MRISAFVIVVVLRVQLLHGMVPDSAGIGKSVKIGTQEWMTKNLNVSYFRNGDPIPVAKTREEWQQANLDHKPVCGVYGNDSLNGEKYGKLYNWYAVQDPSGLAPVGWHVPCDAEWTRLTDYLGGEAAAGMKMKCNGGWLENGNGSDNVGFSALPGGACADDGYLGSVGYLGVWWSTTEDTAYTYDRTAQAWYRSLYYLNGKASRQSHSKGNGFSVRCVKD